MPRLHLFAILGSVCLSVACSDVYAPPSGPDAPTSEGTDIDRSILGSVSIASNPMQLDKLMAPDGVTGDNFGLSVAVSGDLAVIGAEDDDDAGANSGGVYVFRRAADGTWSQEDKLVAQDGSAFDVFGTSVAIDGDLIAVGARGDDDTAANAGSVYLFRLNAANWTQEAKLLAADGGSGDEFGISVAVSGDRVMVGAHQNDAAGSDAGAAYVFRMSAGVWTLEAKLTALDGAPGDLLGATVSLDGDVAVLGADGDDDLGSGAGAAYVFRFDGTTWGQEAKLLATDGTGGNEFGSSVAVDGDLILIGARRNVSTGSAYLFRHGGGTTWTQEAKLVAADGAPLDSFGVSVGLHAGLVVIGAQTDDDNGSASGSAYVFQQDAGSWLETAKLVPADGASQDLFGAAVGVGEGTVLVGAWGDDDRGRDAGSAYVTSVAPPVLTPEEQLAQLLDAVGALLDEGKLNRGQAKALTSKLEGALAALERGNTAAGLNQLNAFLNQVSAFLASGVLSPEDGQALLDAVAAAIDSLVEGEGTLSLDPYALLP